jgi:hypothetical protein
MKNQKRVSIAEAVALFSDPKKVNGNTIISMDTCTIPKLTGGKKNPMQGLIKKFTSGSIVQVFQNQKNSSYAAKVQRNMTKEGIDPETFELKPRTWGVRVPNTPIVEHTKDEVAKVYLETLGIKAGSVNLRLSGKEMQPSEIEGYKINSYGGQGGQEKKVVINCWSFESIIAFRLNGDSYIIEN